MDAGCGSVGLAAAAARHVQRVIATDITPGELDRAKRIVRERRYKNIDVLYSDMRNTNFPDQHFDRIISFKFLEELSDRDLRHVFREFKRILKDDGLMVHCSFDTSAREWIEWAQTSYSLHFRDPSAITSICAELGLLVQVIRLEYRLKMDRRIMSEYVDLYGGNRALIAKFPEEINIPPAYFLIIKKK